MRPDPPLIPDHELFRRIGQGAYGEVWLARNALGTWRAVKIVYRDNFKDARPYEREFAGIRRFEPLSPSNEGFVDILRQPFFPVGFERDGRLATFVATPTLRPVLIDPATFRFEPTSTPQLCPDINYGFTLNRLSRDGRWLALWCQSPEGELLAEVWDRRSGTFACIVPALSPVVSFAPKRQLIATTTADAEDHFSITLWQLPEGTPRWTYRSRLEVSGGIPALLPDERIALALGAVTEPLTLFQLDGDTLQPWWELSPAHFHTFSVAATTDGSTLATSDQGEIFLRSLPSLEVLGVLRGHTRAGVLVAFSPDGRTLASIADDRTVRLWHVPTQRELLRLQSPDPDQGRYELEFSPEGRALAYARWDRVDYYTKVLFAPSLAEIAAAEGDDYPAAAGEDPALWLAVARTLLRRDGPEDALEAPNPRLPTVRSAHGSAHGAERQKGGFPVLGLLHLPGLQGHRESVTHAPGTNCKFALKSTAPSAMDCLWSTTAAPGL